MKTFGVFQSDATWAVENLISEAEGFKDQVKRRRKKKSAYLSPRTAKLRDLRARPDSWKGLE